MLKLKVTEADVDLAMLDGRINRLKKGHISCVIRVWARYLELVVASDSDLDGDGSDSSDSNSDESVRSMSPQY
ncbi:unnamed protein product [Phytophthora fragariaefolia]|uniref:Unnamed protein product n=1 Tax=Phytophthora fragariaefolia TaxID=1490495 RepID=A0A9W6YN16_9STRA|nr:unnamed protein product [Phytophthora fragariaefolia]